MLELLIYHFFSLFWICACVLNTFIQLENVYVWIDYIWDYGWLSGKID